MIEALVFINIIAYTLGTVESNQVGPISNESRVIE